MIKFVDVTKVYDNNTSALKNVNNPDILIANESTENLDPKTAIGIMDTLGNVNKNGTTILMATHAKDIVDSMKKRVIAIENGAVIRDEIRGTCNYEY